ncbi:hypothetical protein AGMMS49965_05930 [Bacteroidia bacterium]|nr:hypothetical protein AGMMS49965_05930 [Bacteroidia bacterium]
MAEHNKTKKKKNPFQSILGGGILSEDALVRQWKLLTLIVVGVILLISNDYACRKKVTEIERLKMELQHLQYENLNLMMRFTKESRQPRLKELLRASDIELRDASTPAFEITKDETKGK